MMTKSFSAAVCLIMGCLVLPSAPLSVHAAGARCESLFAGSQVGASTLNSNQVQQTLKNLAALRLHLDQAQAEGKSSALITALRLDYKQKEQAFLTHLTTKGAFTPEKFHQAMREEILKLQALKQGQNKEVDQVKKTQAKVAMDLSSGTVAPFHRIEPGSYNMRYSIYEDPVPVTLTQPYDMMAILTTQYVWKKIAEVANEKLNLSEALPLDPSRNKGDALPVETVSRNTIEKWLGALNELSRLGDDSIIQIIPDHKPGDVYDLPTLAQWIYVATQRGTYDGKFFPGHPEIDPLQFAWSIENSGLKTQPVAQLLPLKIGNMEFFDLVGNVFEYVKDNYKYTWDPSLVVDPLQRGPDLKYAIIIGTSKNSLSRNAGYNRSGHTDPDRGMQDAGFRFIRKARP